MVIAALGLDGECMENLRASPLTALWPQIINAKVFYVLIFKTKSFYFILY